MRPLWMLAVAGAAGSALLLAAILTGWLAIVARAGFGSASGCESPVVGQAVPSELTPIFSAAATRYELGADGAAVLAGLTSVESDFGRNMGPSSAGAIGWTQFLPSTWRRYGVDADGDGTRDPYNAADAIFAAANYLRASGAPSDWRRALFAYNHAGWYVDRVLDEARTLGGNAASAVMCATPVHDAAADFVRVGGGGRIVPIPGQPGERIDERILRDVLFLIREFHVTVTDGYAPRGHKEHGEHPLGLAVDLAPRPRGTWDDVDRLARWAEPIQGQPRPPFRWVGYDGDAGHGRGHHLHLSWRHAGVPARVPPARWVDVLRTNG